MRLRWDEGTGAYLWRGRLRSTAADDVRCGGLGEGTPDHYEAVFLRRIARPIVMLDRTYDLHWHAGRVACAALRTYDEVSSICLRERGASRDGAFDVRVKNSCCRGGQPRLSG